MNITRKITLTTLIMGSLALQPMFGMEQKHTGKRSADEAGLQQSASRDKARKIVKTALKNGAVSAAITAGITGLALTTLVLANKSTIDLTSTECLRAGTMLTCASSAIMGGATAAYTVIKDYFFGQTDVVAREFNNAHVDDNDYDNDGDNDFPRANPEVMKARKIVKAPRKTDKEVTAEMLNEITVQVKTGMAMKGINNNQLQTVIIDMLKKTLAKNASKAIAIVNSKELQSLTIPAVTQQALVILWSRIQSAAVTLKLREDEVLAGLVSEKKEVIDAIMNVPMQQ